MCAARGVFAVRTRMDETLAKFETALHVPSQPARISSIQTSYAASRSGCFLPESFRWAIVHARNRFLGHPPRRLGPRISSA